MHNIRLCSCRTGTIFLTRRKDGKRRFKGDSAGAYNSLRKEPEGFFLEKSVRISRSPLAPLDRRKFMLICHTNWDRSSKASPVQGEGDRRKAVVGLLQTCGFDENSKFAQTLNNPSDRRGIAKAIPWKKHLLAFMGGSHFRLRLKPELFHSA